MNCHDFEAIASDLARDQLMDAAQREEALGHSKACVRCGSRLADEQALTGGLRFVAAMANEEAPARVEAALLMAFRQEKAAAPATSTARIVKRRWVYAAASVAAVLLIVALLALIASRTRDAQQAAPQNAVSPSPAVPDEPRPASPEPQASPKSRDAVAAIDATQARRKPLDRDRRVGRSKPADSNPPAANAEIATEFFPLMNREMFAQMDGGQVMRVELPRSALMSFGLPMDMERAAERIKADVVVGNDGLARAIRFVR